MDNTIYKYGDIKGYIMTIDGRTGNKQKDVTEAIVIREAVQRLDIRKQAIIGLRAYGYTQQAVAELLSISRYTVWMDEKKALILLRSNV